MVDWEALRERRNAPLLLAIVGAPLVAVALVLGPLSIARGELEADTRSYDRDLGALSRTQLEQARSSPAVQVRLGRFFGLLSGSARPAPSHETLAVARALAALAEESGVSNLGVTPREAGDASAEMSPLGLESPEGGARLSLVPVRMTLRANADFFPLQKLLESLSAPGRPYQIERLTLRKRGALVYAEIGIIYFGLAESTSENESLPSDNERGAES